MALTKMTCRTVACAVIAVAFGALPGPSSVYANDMDTCRPMPRPGHFAPRVPSIVGQALFDQLVAWVAINTSYDLIMVYSDPPTLSFCQVGETVDYEQADLLVDVSLLAAYDRQERHIFLTRPWSPLNLFDQSVLLHELIHDVQLQNRDWACPGAPEREAYLLQDKWLVEHGVDHPFDWRMISRLSRCD